MIITINKEGPIVKIHYDGLLHISFDREKFLGFQGYLDLDKSRAPYCIEIILVGNTIMAEYNSREKWEQILKAIDELI